jgi:D-alanyl-D-alanine carboxypeptidase
VRRPSCRWPLLALALLATACGVDPADSAPAPTTTSVPPTTAAPATAAPTTTAAAPPTTGAEQERSVLVAWAEDDVDDTFVAAVSAVEGVGDVVAVRSGNLHLLATADASGRPVDQPPKGFVIPVDAVVLDGSGVRRFVDDEIAAAVGGLRPDQVVLGETAAAIRRLGPGGRLVVEGGQTLTVAAVVPDRFLGSAEVVAVDVAVYGDDPPEPRFAYVDYDGDADELEDELTARLGEEEGVKVRYLAASASPRPRTTRTQAAIKEKFGEFSYRPVGGGRFEIDPDWMAANIVTTTLPLVGETKCHRAMVPILRDVLQGLVDDGLASVIDPAAFQGCWNSRFIAGTDRLSRHAFGAAVDVNFGNALDGGAGSPVNPELLARMEAAGLTSGHDWSNPDPGHFEWYEDP